MEDQKGQHGIAENDANEKSNNIFDIETKNIPIRIVRARAGAKKRRSHTSFVLRYHRNAAECRTVRAESGNTRIKQKERIKNGPRKKGSRKKQHRKRR